MLIAVPVNSKDLNKTICTSFGRAPYFLIYDSDKEEYECMNNTAVDSTGGAGIKAAQNIVDSGTDILLTLRCGINAADVIKSSGIKIYRAEEVSATDNINMFINKELHELNEIHSGHHRLRGL